MYSDYVGVTYNKTHAKYQACITHYRKQHYLGRYKLAVDAALAYDESAKLLKGPNWKVNFRCLVEYEAARKRELDLLHTTTNYGSGGGGTGGGDGGGGVGMMRGEYDDKRGIAAVTAKVNEIATLVAQSKAAAAVAAESRMMSSQSTSNNVATSTSRSTGCSSNVDDLPVINGPSVNSSIQHRARQHWLEEEERLSTSRNVIMKMPQSAGLASSTFTTASASVVGKDDKYEKKVTPSPSFPLMTGPGGEHDIDEVDIDNEDMEEDGEHSCNNNNSSDDGNSSEQRPRIARPLDTPYTLSPNPARHALGNNERDTTPDSVIRPTVLSYPTVLTYHQSVEERSSPQEQQQQCSSSGSKRRRMDGGYDDGLDETSSSSTDAGLPLSSHHNSPSKSKSTMSMMSLDKIESSGCAVDVIAANELISMSPERIRMVVVNKKASSTSLPTATMTKEEEPVILNGTLAAASALMTLFGKDRSTPNNGIHIEK